MDEEFFFIFLQQRAMGITQAALVPASNPRTLASNIENADQSIDAPSSSPLILSVANSLSMIQNSDSWQKLGIEPALLTRPGFRPQTPPPTPTPPCPILHLQTTYGLSMEPPHPSLTPSCPIISMEPDYPSPTPEECNPPSDSTSHDMEIDDLDQPPSYQPPSPLPKEPENLVQSPSTSTEMDVDSTESLVLPKPFHSAQVQQENHLPFASTSRSSHSRSEDSETADEEDLSDEDEEGKYGGVRVNLLAESFEKAVNVNVPQNRKERRRSKAARRKQPKSNAPIKRKADKLAGTHELKGDKKDFIDLSLEEVSRHVYP
jgi:hypothetical protein